jgi:predicted NBD/HSP70 family sugar kinase
MEAVLRAARGGEPTALAAMDHVGRWLGRGLAGLVNILNPERIVLGGRFGRLFPFVSATVATQLDRYTIDAPRRMVTIVPAALGEDAPLLGAAELAFEPFLNDPAAWLRPRAASQRELASA